MAGPTSTKLSLSSDTPSASPRGSNSESATTLRADDFDRDHLLLDDWTPASTRGNGNGKSKSKAKAKGDGNGRKRSERDLIYRKVLQAMTVVPSSPAPTDLDPITSSRRTGEEENAIGEHRKEDGSKDDAELTSSEPPSVAAPIVNASALPTPTERSDSTPVKVSPRPWHRLFRSVGLKRLASSPGSLSSPSPPRPSLPSSSSFPSPSSATVHDAAPTLSVFSLEDDGVIPVLEALMVRHGRSTNASFLDASYRIYLPADRQAAVCFKRSKNVAVVYGDPLCDSRDISRVFESFRAFCRRQRWRVAVVGAGPILADHARAGGWGCMEFGVESIFDPMTNPILDETAGKTIVRFNRKLFHTGVKFHVYDPSRGICPKLERDLLAIYHDWREARLQRGAPQTYSTVLNPFAMPRVCRHIYTTGPDGQVNGFASLVRLGASGGYLLEPCIAAAHAPKGITEFLTTHALGLLRDEGVDYMTFGLAPLPELGQMTGMPSVFVDATRAVYRTTFNALSLGGKKLFHEKFKPEDDRRVPLHILFPPGFPLIKGTRAVLDVTHISLREVWRSTQARPSASSLATVTASKEGGPAQKGAREGSEGASPKKAGRLQRQQSAVLVADEKQAQIESTHVMLSHVHTSCILEQSVS